MSSRRIEAGGSKVSREDAFFIDPTEIVVDFNGNGRWHPLDHAKVVEYAKSFSVDGQLQPCLARPLPDKRIQLSAGFHRYAAAMLIRNGSAQDGIDADVGFRLMVRVIAMNEKEAFRANVIENKKRNETSAIDDAHNYRRLKMHGYDDGEVKLLFECKDARLKTLETLLVLPDDIQLLIHNRQLTVSQGVEMSKMNDDERKEVLASSVVPHENNGHDQGLLVDATRVQADIDAFALTPGTVDRKAVTRAIKDKKVEQGKKVSLTMAELREFLSEFSDDEEGNVNARAICSCFADFLSGKRKVPWMKDQLAKHAKAK